jgi:hypothetical protein
MPNPKIGKIVHYVFDNGEERPAIVTDEVQKDGHAKGFIGLHVLLGPRDVAKSFLAWAKEDRPPSGRKDGKHTPGTWHWPGT